MTDTEPLGTEAICELGLKIVHALPSDVVERHRGQPIAVDVRTGDYEIASTIEAADDAMLRRGKSAGIYLGRVGGAALWRIGGSRGGKSA